MTAVVHRNAQGSSAAGDRANTTYDVAIVGGGRGTAVAASLKTRKPELSVAIVDLADFHYYRPGWTLVGAGAFDAQAVVQFTPSHVPQGVAWLGVGGVAFAPQRNELLLQRCPTVGCRRLVVVPGLQLNWGCIDGLEGTLGRHGVTLNYRY